jgi:hypothetical protein
MFGLFGLGIVATDLFPPSDIAVLQKVWPTIRIAARWTDPNWSLLGYPNGAPVTPVTFAILNAAWGDVRRAANFSDINWSATPELTPQMIAAAQAELAPPPPAAVAAAAPVPEVINTPSPTGQPNMTIIQGPTSQPAGTVVGESFAPAVPSPVTQPVPEVVSPGTVAAPSGLAPSFNLPVLPTLPTGGSPDLLLDQYGNPILPPATTTPAAAPIQAGMFGNMSLTTWLILGGVVFGGLMLFGKHENKLKLKRLGHH